MKDQLITFGLLLTLIVVAGVSRAQAQIVDRLKADIPFSFYVGEKLLPAGEYVVTEKEPGLMLIQEENRKASAFFLTVNYQEPKAPTASELIFNKYGDETFLTRIEEKGDVGAVELLKSKLEKRVERDTEEGGQVSLLLHN